MWHYLPQLASENSRSLPELAAEYSEEPCSDGEPCAPLKSSPSVGRCCSDAKWMDAYRASLSGTTSEHSTATPGAAASMSSAADSRARTFQQPEKAQESTEPEAGCGERWHEWFAKYDRDTSSWRTRQCSLLEGLDVFSETWPRWGLMRGGACWEVHRFPEAQSFESDYGWLPAPMATDGTTGGGASAEKRKQVLEPARLVPCGYGWNGWDSGPEEKCKVLGVADGLAGQLDRIHAAGNGQVPAVVALAWETLGGGR